MKKAISAVLVAGTLVLAGALPGHAWGPGGGPGHPGFHGRHRDHLGVSVFVGPRVLVGPRFWWGLGFYGAYPYWDGYPVYGPRVYVPPVVIREEPQVYIQQQPEPQPQAYWYYCQDPQGYYPYVQQCPGGWLTVVPPTGEPRQ